MSVTASPGHWRSLPAPQRDPLPSAEHPSEIDRRTLLKLIGAATAMAIPAGCTRAAAIVPYVRQPEDAVAGELLHYATTLDSDGFGIGALVTSHQGRPIKIEVSDPLFEALTVAAQGRRSQSGT